MFNIILIKEPKNHKKAIFKPEMAVNKKNIFLRIWNFYAGGFQNLSNWGRQVWIIILIKLFILFAVLRIFFFPDFLKTNFKTDSERSEHVLEILTEPKQ